MGDLFYKKLRNRTPDGVKIFFNQYVFPYGTIILIAGFVLTINFAHAAAANITFIPNDQVMDLGPIDVANVVNNISPYTPVVQTDAVAVALVMDNKDYVGKPIITETAQTVIVAPVATENRTATTNYTVQDNDTLSSIGWKFGLKIATIKYANNLTSETIKPGQVLKLPAADISPSLIAAATAKKKVAGAKTVNRKPGSSVNGYPYGWCTYWVATKRYVPPHWGNARSWLASARSAGYSTGSEPAVGAIMVSSESSMGHVAYVESVSGGSITISEMNYRGWGVSSTRTISAHAGQIMGYVY